jgi:hypothetical protein
MSADASRRAYWAEGDGGHPLHIPAPLPLRDRIADFLLWYALPYLVAVPVATAAGVAVAWLGLVLGWV